MHRLKLHELQCAWQLACGRVGLHDREPLSAAEKAHNWQRSVALKFILDFGEPGLTILEDACRRYAVYLCHFPQALPCSTATRVLSDSVITKKLQI
jgi:hypothetical protein